MRHTLRPLLPYLIMLAADFYLLPLLIRDTGAAMVLMLCVIPVLAFAVGAAYGVRRGFCPALAVAAALLFLPTVSLFYNETALVYAAVYGLLVLAGNGAGRAFYRKKS